MENNEQKQKSGFLPGMLVGVLIGIILLSGVFLGVRLYQYNQTKNSDDQGEAEAASVVNPRCRQLKILLMKPIMAAG